MIRYSQFDLAFLPATGALRNGLPLRELQVDVHVIVADHYYLTIPKGFVSDGMTLPRLARLRWRDNWDPRYASAALLHDYLLKHSKLRKWEIDWLFMGALRSSGVSALEAGLFWLCVRTKNPGRVYNNS